MGDKTLTAAEAEDAFWDHLKKSNTGMLGLDQPGYHSQPMTAFREEESGIIWFFTRRETDLAQAVAAGAGDAAFMFLDRKLQACIDGRLSLAHDRERIDRYWNAHVAAWYPEGKDDPQLTLLRLDVTEAAVWITEGGLLKYAFEVAKANTSKSTPDVGERRDLNFH